MPFYSAPSRLTFSFKRSEIFLLHLTCQKNKGIALEGFYPKGSNLYLRVNFLYVINNRDYLLFSFWVNWFRRNSRVFFAIRTKCSFFARCVEAWSSTSHACYIKVHLSSIGKLFCYSFGSLTRCEPVRTDWGAHTWMVRLLFTGLFCSNKPLNRVEPSREAVLTLI